MCWLLPSPIATTLPARQVGKMRMLNDEQKAARVSFARVRRAVTCYGQRFESLREAERRTGHAISSIRLWADDCRNGWGWVA